MKITDQKPIEAAGLNTNSQSEMSQDTSSKKGLNFKLPRISPRVIFPIAAIAVIAFGFVYYKSLFVAAVVNGQPIYRPTVIKYLEKTQGAQVLDNLITEALIAQEAKKQNITVSQEELDAEISKIEQTLQAQGLELESAMAQQNITREELNKQLTLQKKLEKMLISKIEVTDEEIAKYKEDNAKYLPENADSQEFKDQVIAELKQQKLSLQYSTWIQEAKASAKIMYFVNYGTVATGN